MISCHLYDYIEIACMHQYPVKLTMKNGKVFECTALDTKYNDAKQECIKVRLNNSTQGGLEEVNKDVQKSVKTNSQTNIQEIEPLIPLDDLATLNILIENPHFTFVSFT